MKRPRASDRTIQRQHCRTTPAEVGELAIHLHEIAEHLEGLTGEGLPLIVADAPGTIADILQLRLRASGAGRT